MSGSARGRSAAAALLLIAAAAVPAAGDEFDDYGRLSLKLGRAAMARRYDEADEAAGRLLELVDRSFADWPALQVMAWATVLGYDEARGRPERAEALRRRVLEAADLLRGADDMPAVQGLDLVAFSLSSAGRHVEAERLYRRALELRARFLGPDAVELLPTLLQLGFQAQRLGRPDEAEACYRRLLAIADRHDARGAPDARSAEVALATLYANEGRRAEAEALYRRVIAAEERPAADPPTGALVGAALLGLLCAEAGRLDEAEAHYRAALERTDATELGPMKPAFLAGHLDSLAGVLRRRGRLDEAEAAARRSLALNEGYAGPDDLSLAAPLMELARIAADRGLPAEALALMDRAIPLFDETRPTDLVERSRIAWDAGDRDGALADLGRAMDLAEDRRARPGGDERERAFLFGRDTDAFDLTVARRAELGDAAAAFDASERARARALLDRMELAGAPLLAGLPAAEAEALRRQEAEARVRLTGLERRRDGLGPGPEREAVEAELADARQEALLAAREIRAASPAYRRCVGRGGRPIALETAMADLVGPGGLLLKYVLTPEAGFVIVADGPAGRSWIVPLVIGPAEARALRCGAGPLDLPRAAEALAGPLLTLREPGPPGRPGLRALEALGRVLLPDEQRAGLVAGRYDRLTVVTDGPLAFLSFEALVTDAAGPSYLLDSGVPVHYGPSATLLWNAMQRPSEPTGPDLAPVLSVADPAPAGSGTAGDDPTLARLSDRGRYRASGGRLGPLPFARDESDRLAGAFRRRGHDVDQLLGEHATEAAFRAAAAGRRVVHLACHGLVDPAWGNAFGALALSSSEPGDPADDGFLALSELAELDFRSCELAILSACETNLGPLQRAEGAWGLSGAILAAGARRVVASNWKVDDRSAAEFVGALAEGVAADPDADLAAAVLEARLRLRRGPDGASPHGWAAFILIGPP